MPLTTENLAILKRPFSRADHDFLKEFVYLTEEAICNRIEEVDPSWSFEIQRMDRTDKHATVTARMTICGVAREGVGMQAVLNGPGEPEKGAATDALKRCARLFGVGRYLLDAPDKDKFDKWLAEKQKEAGIVKTYPPQIGQESDIRPTPAVTPAVTATASPPNSASTSTTAMATEGSSSNILTLQTDATPKLIDKKLDKADNTLDMPQIGSIDMKALLKLAYEGKWVSGRNHFINLINLLYRNGDIRDAMNAAQVLEEIKRHESAQDLAKEEKANGKQRA